MTIRKHNETLLYPDDDTFVMRRVLVKDMTHQGMRVLEYHPTCWFRGLCRTEAEDRYFEDYSISDAPMTTKCPDCGGQ